MAAAQLAAGADSIGMSAAASLVGPTFYRDFLWPRQMRILAAVRETGAMARVHMCGCTDPLAQGMAQLPADVYEIDFLTDLSRARDTFGPDRTICGNLDTIATMLTGTAEEVVAAARHCHQVCGARHIVAPGCEVAPLTPPANVRALVGYARGAASLSPGRQPQSSMAP